MYKADIGQTGSNAYFVQSAANYPEELGFSRSVFMTETDVIQLTEHLLLHEIDECQM